MLWWDRADPELWYDNSEAADIADPIEPAEANEPTLANDAKEAALAIERTESWEQIDRTEFSDQSDHTLSRVVRLGGSSSRAHRAMTWSQASADAAPRRASGPSNPAPATRSQRPIRLPTCASHCPDGRPAH